MGYWMIYGRNGAEILQHMKECLEAEGWSDVVIGGNCITVPAFAPCYKKRIGFRWEGWIKFRPILCDDHEEGKAPKNEERYKRHDFWVGIGLATKLNEHITLLPLHRSKDERGHPFMHVSFAKVVDENNNPKGLLLWSNDIVFYHDQGKMGIDLLFTRWTYTKDQKIIAPRHFIVRDHIFIGYVSGILEWAGEIAGGAYNYKYGHEIYMPFHHKLYRIE